MALPAVESMLELPANGASVTVSVKKLLVTADLETVVNLKKEDGSADASATATLKIVVTKGNSPVELAESYDVFVGTEKIGTTGQSLTVENGAVVIVKGLPAGTAYEVTATLPEGYDAPDAVTGNIYTLWDNEVTFNAQKNLVTADLSVAATVKLEDGSAAEDKIQIEIKLTKGNSPVNLEDSYDIFLGNEKLGNTKQILSIADGEVFTVKDLPVGAAYEIIATPADGYTDTTTGATSGNITANGARVNLSAEKNLITADLSISADVTLENGDASTDKVNVKVQLTKGNAPVDLAASYEVYVGTNKIGTTDNTLAIADGETFTVKGLPVGLLLNGIFKAKPP